MWFVRIGIGYVNAYFIVFFKHSDGNQTSVIFFRISERIISSANLAGAGVDCVFYSIGKKATQVGNLIPTEVRCPNHFLGVHIRYADITAIEDMYIF